jgi:hypothetical protein
MRQTYKSNMKSEEAEAEMNRLYVEHIHLWRLRTEISYANVARSMTGPLKVESALRSHAGDWKRIIMASTKD